MAGKDPHGELRCHSPSYSLSCGCPPTLQPVTQATSTSRFRDAFAMARSAASLLAFASAAVVCRAATEPIVRLALHYFLSGFPDLLSRLHRMQDQISLSLTANAGEMAVTWISYAPYKPSYSGSATYWATADPLHRFTVRCSICLPTIYQFMFSKLRRQLLRRGRTRSTRTAAGMAPSISRP